MTGRLAGRVILVTGSSSGIGRATARLAVAEGAVVMIHGRTEAEVEPAAAELSAPSVVIDLAGPDAGTAVVEATLRAFGRIDGLVNNAGMFPRAGIMETTPEGFDLILAVNVKAALFATQRAARAFREQSSKGVVVNIGSVNAHAGQPDLLPYSMSKAAMSTMTRNVADALAPDGVRVNQINPGWVLTETEIETQRRLGRPDDWPSSIPPLWAPTGGLLSPEMIARHVIFWLSDESAPVTGQVYDAEQTPFLGRSVMSRVT